MTVAPEILYGLGAFALLGGRLCGGIQWKHWNRVSRRWSVPKPEGEAKA